MTDVSQYEFLIALLLAILTLELVARRLRLPPAAAFIGGGIVLALMPGIPSFVIDPDLIMVVFLPPLLMNGAYFTVWREFRENFSGILLLALGTVAFTTLVVGLAAKWLVPDLPWAICFALGAIVSPPDAVAANAVLERLSLPGNLNALLQGESLLNDASGLVLFRLALATALTGVFSPTMAAGSFCVLVAGGVAVGVGVGYAGLFVIRRVRDSELVTTATLLLAAASYVGGEKLHVSGVLATVTTGLLLGWHQHDIFTAATRMRGQAFWRVMVFLLESFLFILIGLSLRGVLERLGTHEAAASLLVPVLGVIGAVVASRFVWLFGSDVVHRLARRLGHDRGAEPSFSVATVMSWAGMRGVVTLAAALSLPLGLPGRDFVLVSAFAVILVTVLIQGTTLAPLIRWVGLAGKVDPSLERRAEDRAWLRMAEAQYDAIAARSRRPDGEQSHPRLLEQFAHRVAVARGYIEDQGVHSALKTEHFTVVIAALQAGRKEALRMHRAGEIHDKVLRELEQELDLQQLVAESHV